MTSDNKEDFVAYVAEFLRKQKSNQRLMRLPADPSSLISESDRLEVDLVNYLVRDCKTLNDSFPIPSDALPTTYWVHFRESAV
jgi:hypothetical protein